MAEEDRILSIQSHVVHGYVGNKSATFPLQLLGFEVDAINSVQFSNHTGYAKGFKGQVLDDKQLWDLIEGLQANDVDRYSHIINGYIGSESFLLKLAQVVRTLKAKNPSLIYVCDPVMGDFDQGIYVPKELLPVYRSEILPLADVCVPNQYEAELITEMKITSEADAIKAMKCIRDLGSNDKTVILSSTELGGEDKKLICLALSSDDSAYKIEFPKYDANFVGTGDLFTALSTAWLRKSGGDLKTALENTIASMQAILETTFKAAKAKAGPDQKPSAAQMELKLIRSKRIIENPEVSIRAEKVSL